MTKRVRDTCAVESVNICKHRFLGEKIFDTSILKVYIAVHGYRGWIFKIYTNSVLFKAYKL